ncbi:MAG: acyltransferase [Cyclobacteriaceae bacterium]
MTSSSKHLPNLDALRTLSFLSVFFYHSFHTEYKWIKENYVYQAFVWIFRNGDLGVIFFFVLSGYLITFLLLKEEDDNQRISVSHFYIRRVLRIWPLYMLTVVFGFTVFPVLKSAFGQVPMESADIVLFITFLSNFNNIWNGLPDASILGVLWSVSIEEQFYLVWPLIIVAFKRRRILAFTILIALSISFRLAFFNNSAVLYFHTMSVLSSLAIGGLFGFIGYNKLSNFKFLIDLKKSFQLTLYLITVVVVLFRQEIFIGQVLNSLEITCFSILFAIIILTQSIGGRRVIEFGSFGYLSRWGKYTYGMYCLHFIGILIATNTTKLYGFNESLIVVIVIETLFALLVTHGLAWISYVIFEKRFLKIKEKRFST